VCVFDTHPGCSYRPYFYLLLGLISTANEMIAAKLKTRAKFLDQGIDRLLDGDPEPKSQLYQHPLISAPTRNDQHCPSYIPAEKFATALLDIVSGRDKPLTDVDALREGVKKLGTPALQTSLKALMDSSPDTAALKNNVEEWFNDTMDRVSGWYKRNAKRNALLLACAVTLVMNADTVNVAHVLWTNPSMRAAVVDEARLRAAKKPPDESLPMVEYRNSNDATASTPVNVPSSAEEGLSSNEQKLMGQLTGWGPDWEKLGAASGVAAWLAALKRAWIEQFKDRATIDATFTIDHAHPRPNPPAKDGDMHVAGRAPKEIGLPMVAETMNAADASEQGAVSTVHSNEDNGQFIAVSGAWRLWFEHPRSTGTQIQFAAVPPAANTNPDRCFEIHPLTKLGSNDFDGLAARHQRIHAGHEYRDFA
jgi:hypothetical protein